MPGRQYGPLAKNASRAGEHFRDCRAGSHCVCRDQFNFAIKEREAQSKFVELAVSILVQPVQQENRPLRVWATEVVNRYSGVKLGEHAIMKGELAPFVDVRLVLAELGYYAAPLGVENLKEQASRTAEAVRRSQQDRRLPSGWGVCQ